MTGLVYKSTGSWYTVKSEQGDFIECRMKGKFRIKGIKSTNPIAVGDIVDYELEETSDTVTGSKPLLSALFLNMSAKKLDTTALNP